MSNSLRQILIPADLTINTEIAIKKGLQLADKNTFIHLLHVQNYGFPGLSFDASRFLKPDEEKDYKIITRKLEKWKEFIEKSIPGIAVAYHINTKDEIQKGIEKQVRCLLPDLIIVGKRSHHKWFSFLNTVNPGKITKHTGVPMLALKPNSLNCNTNTVIVCIDSVANTNKMKLVEIICKKFNPKVHLIAFCDNSKKSTDFYTRILTGYCQWLSATGNSPAEYLLFHGKNKGRKILDHAKKIKADLVILNADNRLQKGLVNPQLWDLINADSTLQVLSTSD